MDIQLVINKPLLRAYFDFLFTQDESGNYGIGRASDFGKILCSFVRYTSQKPEPIPEAVNLTLPKSDGLKNAANYYMRYSREDLIRINDLLEVFFNIDFDRYYLKGKKLGLLQKHIIESFIISRNLTNLMHDHETLKKKEYREELRLLKERCGMLTRKAYYRNEKIESGMQNILVN
ncbi:hypothetical protein GCM10027284_09030 [Cyclobacterium sediminis]